ncbi:SGNH/GDSL hydrolase family protein [uncultured Dokdonia sp.]|uniref:SGNH/GDSL hydrolase family protein n=1 Tax=uncultured Dokdonia sp. TaxID=575653 RepID=UPI002628B3CD|nr:SGNH/GDSL hydrolase family protein [uncultured Dokdonia sp.]
MKGIKRTLKDLFIFFFLKPSSAQDWPNLKRYKEENEVLKIPNKDRIVFIGDSITEGWLRERPEFFENKPYVNRGVDGQTTPQILLRFRQDVINLKPSVVVILAGINDIAGNTGFSTIQMIEDNIISMEELAKANNIKVILCSVLPAYHFYWRKGLKPAEKVIELNARLKTYTTQNNLIYVDYFTSMANTSNGLKEELGRDGIHPNVAGYLIMEPLIEEAISKALTQH